MRLWNPEKRRYECSVCRKPGCYACRTPEYEPKPDLVTIIEGVCPTCLRKLPAPTFKPGDIVERFFTGEARSYIAVVLTAQWSAYLDGIVIGGKEYAPGTKVMMPRQWTRVLHGHIHIDR